MDMQTVLVSVKISITQQSPAILILHLLPEMLLKKTSISASLKIKPESQKNKKAENIYTEKVLQESADGYKGLHCLMDSVILKEHTLHYIKPEAIKTFFQNIF